VDSAPLRRTKHAQDSKSKAISSEDQQSSQSSEQQDKDEPSHAHPQRVSEKELRDKKVTKINKATTFIGMNINNLQNENLGKVEDLVFNPDTGKIAYAVISVGGFLGMNEKYIALPLRALTPAPGALGRSRLGVVSSLGIRLHSGFRNRCSDLVVTS
jgi:sporulation protein YlmC with PRC-barrel domain